MLRIRDVYPESRILIFTHPGSKNSHKREGRKKLVVIPFFVATNFTKLKIIFIFEMQKKKYRPILKDIKELLPQKTVIKLSKIWVQYGFEIQK